MNQHPSCGTCFYYVQQGPGERTGRCHRHPPTVIAPLYAYRPVVHGEREWCGEHKPLEPGTPVAVRQKVDPPQRGDRKK
jgi:hypothetical protein